MLSLSRCSSPRPRRSTAAELVRLVAAWLAVILLLQGVAAAHALGAGPLHHHRAAGSGRASPVGHAIEHTHGDGQRHRHTARAADRDAAAAATAVADADALEAMAALAAALNLLAADRHRQPAAGAPAHVRNTRVWPLQRGIDPEPPTHPPRAA
jgi:hypothetical protein